MAGDYILYPQADVQWHVYRVDDILAIKRLVASATSPVTLTPEDTLLDSETPAYFGEAHLLLTVFDPVFADEAAARQAIQQRTLTERVRGLLRCARDFPKDACQVVTP
ncbi:MAG: hypothetical protein ABJA84_00720 [Polaromonas sp.]